MLRGDHVGLDGIEIYRVVLSSHVVSLNKEQRQTYLDLSGDRCGFLPHETCNIVNSLAAAQNVERVSRVD